MKRSNVKKIAALVCAAAVIGGGAWWYFSSNAAEEVKKAVVARGRLTDTYTETGSVSSGSEQYVISEVTGRILESYARVNQEVREGDVLFVIDSSDYEYQRSQASAQISAYRAQLSSLQIGNLMSVSPQEYLSSVRENADLAKSSLDDAENSYEAAKELAEIGAISQSELDRARIAYESASEQYSQASSRYEQSSSMQQELEGKGISGDALNDEFYQSEIRQLNAMISSQSSNVSYIDKLIEKCSVKAPADGVVTSVPADGLSAVTAYQAMAVIKSAREDVVIESSVLTGIAPYIKAGDEAQLKMNFRGGSRTFSAHVSEVYDYASETLSPLGLKEYRVTVKLKPDDPDEFKGLSGYETDVIFTLCDEEDVLTLPSGAVFEDGGKNWVYVIEDGKAAAKEIEIGYKSPSRCIVLAGLSEGDEVIDRVDSNSVYEGAKLRYEKQ